MQPQDLLPLSLGVPELRKSWSATIAFSLSLSETLTSSKKGLDSFQPELEAHSQALGSLSGFLSDRDQLY